MGVGSVTTLALGLEVASVSSATKAKDDADHAVDGEEGSIQAAEVPGWLSECS